MAEIVCRIRPDFKILTRSLLTGIPEVELTQLLGSNAVTCYDLDVSKLAPIAARIGPEKSLFVSEG